MLGHLRSSGPTLTDGTAHRQTLDMDERAVMWQLITELATIHVKHAHKTRTFKFKLE